MNKSDIEQLYLFRVATKRPLVLQYFLAQQNGIETLIKCSASLENYPLPDYSSWVITHFAKNYPNEIEKYQPQLIDAFLQSDNQTVLRNLAVALILLPLSEHREGELYDALLNHLQNADNKVALHVNCVYKLIQFMKKHIELKDEIYATIKLATNRNKQASLLAAERKFLKIYGKQRHS